MSRDTERFGEVLATLALPDVFGRVVRASLPAIELASAHLTAALHPESPRGVKLTRHEGRALARAAANHLERALLDEFLGELDDDPSPALEPSPEPEPEPKSKRKPKQKAPEPPAPEPPADSDSDTDTSSGSPVTDTDPADPPPDTEPNPT